jgi:hypothetical protein
LVVTETLSIWVVMVLMGFARLQWLQF